MTRGGYYDYAPTVVLARPAVLVGDPGCAYREIAYDLASLTGLPLHDTDALAAHEAGQSLWSLARQHGLAAVQALESTALRQALASQPPGLVVVGEGALTVSSTLETVRGAASLVVLTAPAAACYWELCRRAEARDGILGHPHLPNRLVTAEDVQPLRQQLRPVAAAADLVLDLEHRGVHDTVLELQQVLPMLATPQETR